MARHREPLNQGNRGLRTSTDSKHSYFLTGKFDIMRVQFRISLALVLVALATVTTFAKKASVKPVPPVESGGVRYSADRDGRNQYVVATDIANGKQLWKIRVFHNHIKPWIEEDVQWVFITALQLANNAVLVRDEKARCYAIDVKTHRVSRTPCNPIFSE